MKVFRVSLKAHNEVDLCADVLKICGLCFMATISENVMYRTCWHTPNLKAKTHRSAMNDVLRVHNRAGFEVKVIHCDEAFESIMNELEDEMGCAMHCAAKDEHVSEAERNIQVIKERTRAVYHHLSYFNIFKIVLIKGIQDLMLRIT